jgi:hypothetical protein
MTNSGITNKRMKYMNYECGIHSLFGYSTFHSHIHYSWHSHIKNVYKMTISL